LCCANRCGEFKQSRMRSEVNAGSYFVRGSAA
jgi:hypothetical protein